MEYFTEVEKLPEKVNVWLNILNSFIDSGYDVVKLNLEAMPKNYRQAAGNLKYHSKHNGLPILIVERNKEVYLKRLILHD